MEGNQHQFQRRAIVGDRHFIQADPLQPDIWAVPGSVVVAEDENGIRCYGTAPVVATAVLTDWAKQHNLIVRIEEQFPVLRRG